MRLRLPVPANWQDFEALCHQLWKEIWSDPNAQRHGRSGQPQAGVDIYGRPLYGATYEGVQCKDRDGRFGSKLTEKQLLDECYRAKQFEPKIRVFTLATTASSDEAIQGVARKLNGDGGPLPFDVHVWSWDEIEAEISCRPTLLHAFYSKMTASVDGSSVKIAASAPRDQFHAFFSRPQLVEQVGALLKNDLAQVAYELSDNAFLHGHARQVQLSFDGAALSIRDDGVQFDPLKGLDSRRASLDGHLGSYVLAAFQRKYGQGVQLSYDRHDIGGRAFNSVSVQIGEWANRLPIPKVLDIPIDLSTSYGRRGGEGLAEALSIPVGIKELVLTVSDTFNISGSIHFIQRVRDRLPGSALLVVSYPRNHMLGELAHLFDSARVKFHSR